MLLMEFDGGSHLGNKIKTNFLLPWTVDVVSFSLLRQLKGTGQVATAGDLTAGDHSLPRLELEDLPGAGGFAWSCSLSASTTFALGLVDLTGRLGRKVWISAGRLLNLWQVWWRYSASISG